MEHFDRTALRELAFTLLAHGGLEPDKAETVSEPLAAVLRDEVSTDTLPAAVPAPRPGCPW